MGRRLCEHLREKLLSYKHKKDTEKENRTKILNNEDLEDTLCYSASSLLKKTSERDKNRMQWIAEQDEKLLGTATPSLDTLSDVSSQPSCCSHSSSHHYEDTNQTKVKYVPSSNVLLKGGEKLSSYKHKEHTEKENSTKILNNEDLEETLCYSASSLLKQPSERDKNRMQWVAEQDEKLLGTATPSLDTSSDVSSQPSCCSHSSSHNLEGVPALVVSLKVDNVDYKERSNLDCNILDYMHQKSLIENEISRINDEKNTILEQKRREIKSKKDETKRPEKIIQKKLAENKHLGGKEEETYKPLENNSKVKKTVSVQVKTGQSAATENYAESMISAHIKATSKQRDVTSQSKLEDPFSLITVILVLDLCFTTEQLWKLLIRS